MASTPEKPTPPILQLIARDVVRDDDNWQWLAVIHVVGQLAMDADMPTTVSDEQIADIFKFLEAYDIHVQPERHCAPGGNFTHEPWIQWFPQHIIITQSGGRDV